MNHTVSILMGNQGEVRHLRDPSKFRTFCGRQIYKQRTLKNQGEVNSYELCGNCERTNARYLHDTTLPDIEAGATRRGAALADGGRVREVTGRIFRVAGSTDTYTVIIPSDKDLASTCTCMAAKTHPETMCKHQSAVYLTIGGGK